MENPTYNGHDYESIVNGRNLESRKQAMILGDLNLYQRICKPRILDSDQDENEDQLVTMEDFAIIKDAL